MHVVLATDPKLSIRSSTAADEPFLRELYGLVRQSETFAFGWSPEQTEAFLAMQFDSKVRAYAMQFPSAQQLIILADEVPAGQVLLDRRPNEHHIIDITVHPRDRSRGVGSRVLNWILDDAAAAGKAVELKVDRNNVDAKRLYERHGFVVRSETELLFLMSRSPAAH